MCRFVCIGKIFVKLELIEFLILFNLNFINKNMECFLDKVIVCKYALYGIVL